MQNSSPRVTRDLAELISLAGNPSNERSSAGGRCQRFPIGGWIAMHGNNRNLPSCCCCPVKYGSKSSSCAKNIKNYKIIENFASADLSLLDTDGGWG